MKYKLLAIDMDGTFLDKEHMPTKGNIEYVHKAAEAGVKVVVCSGRIPAALKLILKDMPKNQPVIAGNGSIVYDHNSRELYYGALERDALIEIINIMRRDFNNVYYHFYDGDIVCSERFDKIIADFYYKLNSTMPKEFGVEIRIIPDSIYYIDKYNPKVAKVEIFEEDLNLLQSIRDRLEMLPGIEIVSSGFNGIEITNKGLNKGNALEFLVNHYGYSLDECIAVGNDENDVEMIKKAGLGIAVRNAKDCVKEVANYITEKDNDNDAVAEVIKKFILNK
ncbi:Cof-type HAD-IIB family hydrolase [Fonticella tunisiensis]|uniref:Cof subfamily protein (Haloacid dehalogenase superfamily)/HAD superfamily hydrolase (TIGR01484 family) n=1 Tax=Fonticella tunisiensis TaxID=1096341 RepID=A0A4R7KM12_9CLOT|nr:Cof-type HAD-IIB family hydrolase [Fonticella tunisiensis]TDT56524.1 hypothetical protein EDD71_11369 [Fonticella tunisiensis]